MKITRISGHPYDIKYVTDYIINKFGTTTVTAGYVPDFEDENDKPFMVFKFLFDNYVVDTEKLNKILADLHKICCNNPMEGITIFVEIGGAEKYLTICDGIDYLRTNEYKQLMEMISKE